MKRNPLNTRYVVLRVFLPAVLGMLCLAFVAAPWLEACGRLGAGAVLRAFFSLLCHQEAARSFSLLGHPWAVCHRCSGIYFGLFLLSLCPLRWNALVDEPRYRRVWIAAATMPLLLDALLPFAGLWINTAATRLATGALFGCMLASLLVRALVDCARAVPRPCTGSARPAPGGFA